MCYDETMKNNYIYSTADISHFYDLTAKGLAYYEEQGIIHPLRKQDSSYRIFTLNDCYSLYHSKMYKNGGLSLKEMANLEKDGTLEEIIRTLSNSSQNELDRIKIETRIQERIQEITNILDDFNKNGNFYKIVDRKECYRLYVRNFDLEHESDKKSSEEFALWNSYIPIDTASLLYPKEKVLSDDEEMNVNIANIITKEDFEFLNLEKTSHVNFYPTCKCMKTIIYGDAEDIDSKKWLKEPLKYLEENHYELEGDILTSMLLVTGERGAKTRYDLAWFPIK